TMYLFFFFFQAEDGIRDRTVTGVQTCALPIYHAVWGFASAGRGHPGCHLGHRAAIVHVGAERDLNPLANAGDRRAGLARKKHDRSEERRVGKESRYRREPDHEKKK